MRRASLPSWDGRSEHDVVTLGQLGTRGHFVRNAGRANLALRTDEALRRGGFGLDEPARDLACRQAAQRPQRERALRLGRKGWMAAGDEQAQAVVFDVVGLFDLHRRRFHVVPAASDRNQEPAASGRTSTVPSVMPGIFSAQESASSRLAASMR